MSQKCFSYIILIITTFVLEYLSDRLKLFFFKLYCIDFHIGPKEGIIKKHRHSKDDAMFILHARMHQLLKRNGIRI